MVWLWHLALGCAVGQPAERIEVVADNSIVIYPGEEHLNAGGAARIRIKGNQHLVALALDTAPLRGRRVRSATLVCTRADESIDGVSISTIAAPWDEATSNYLTAGVADFVGWGRPGARFMDVTGSNGFTLVCHAPSRLVDGAYHWTVDPDLIHANTIGAASGLTLHEFSSDYSRNPTIYAREQRALRPYLLVETGGDEPPPDPPTDLAITTAGDLDTVRLHLTGPAHGFAYDVTVNGVPLPRWNIPFVTPGQPQVVMIRDVPLTPGGELEVEVTCLNRLGERSAPATVRAMLPVPQAVPPAAAPELPEGRPGAIAVIPVIDKYDAAGRPVGDLPEDYRWRNEVYDGETIRLTAARGEVVGFQALLAGQGRVTARCEVGGLRCELWRAVYVETPRGRVPDPLVPCEELTLTPDEATVVVADIYVPFEAPAGVIHGRFDLSDGRAVPIALTVIDATIPRAASFACEMNSYGLTDRLSEFYRLQALAYDHRVHANLLAYGHRTAAPGARKCVMDKILDLDPNVPERRMDEAKYNAIEPGALTTYWDDFVTAFGPWLSGKWSRDAWRGPLPAAGFYLTFHESWPLNVRAYFNGNPDAYQAFAEHPEYAETFVNLLRDFCRLSHEQGWAEAGCQVYLNNKGSLDDPVRNPWILDEPTSYWDYRALAYYADLVKRAKADAPPVRVDYRIDISRPQFDRGELWGKADLWVVNWGVMREYPRLVRDRHELSGERIWVYGTSNPVEESNRTIQAWVLEAFAAGADGVVPWQTIDRSGKALEQGDPLGLFIFVARPGEPLTILPSLRLKAYRQAEQEVELLRLLQHRLGLSEATLRSFVAQQLALAGRVESRSAEDAGTAAYDSLSPERFRTLRAIALALLSGAGG